MQYNMKHVVCMAVKITHNTAQIKIRQGIFCVSKRIIMCTSLVENVHNAK